jgi:hypothetical protein
MGNAAAHLTRADHPYPTNAVRHGVRPLAFPVGLIALSDEWRIRFAPKTRKNKTLEQLSFATDETHPGARSAPMTPPLWRGATL